MRIFKRILLILFGLAIIGAIVVASLPKPAPVDVASVTRGPLHVTVDGDGRTRVEDRYVVTAPLYANLARIELEPGDDVDVGSLVARLSPLQPPLLDARSEAELRARVKAAEAAVRIADASASRARSAAKYAKRDHERARMLADDGNLSTQALDLAELDARNADKAVESARFGARVARHELEMAEAALGRAKGKTKTKTKGKTGADDERAFDVGSPVRGRVLEIFRRHEGVVRQGDPLVEIGDPAALEVVVDVLTEDAVEIEPGDHCLIERWGGAEPLHGTVELIEPSAFTKISALGVEEQRVNVIVQISEPHEVWHRLGDGFRVEVSITVWAQDEVTKVPMGALHRMGEHWAVFVVEDGVARERKITVGRRSGLEVEVLEGIDPGAMVIIHPADSIADGVEVETRA